MLFPGSATSSTHRPSMAASQLRGSRIWDELPSATTFLVGTSAESLGVGLGGSKSLRGERNRKEGLQEETCSSSSTKPELQSHLCHGLQVGKLRH